MKPMTQPRRILLVTLALAALATSSSVVAHDQDDRRGETRVYTLVPSTYGNPEGIAFDHETGAFFVGATGNGAAAGGAIYSGTLDRRLVREFIPGAPGKEAVGMKVARGKLYVAGGFSGTVTVYDIGSRREVAFFQNFGAGMLNDLVVTQHGDVFVTDSFRPILWHITEAQIAAGGGMAPREIPVDPEIAYDGFFNLNGIVSLKGGQSFIVVHSDNGKLFRIDLDGSGPYGRTIQQIAVEPLLFGDGLLIDGGDLIVVQPSGLTFVRLNGRADRGRVIERRSDPSLREPSTVARARNFFLVVNADFSTSLTPFTVTALPRNHAEHDE